MGKVICGIQQVGVGVESVEKAWAWYKDAFGFDVKVFGDEGVAEKMLPYTGGKPQPRYAILVYNLLGGGGLEVWEPRGRKLNYIQFTPEFGDFGIFAAKIKCPDIKAAFEYMKGRGVEMVSSPAANPEGKEHFFVRDPYGNLFDVEQDNYRFMAEKHLTGGINGVILGVGDMDRSVRFYSTIMEYDRVVYDETGVFGDLAGVPGEGYRLRRVRLARTKPLQGPLSEVMGTSYIELVQRLDGKDVPAPRKIYEGRLWGDPGFIHLCFDIRDMEAIRKDCESLGHSFVCDGGRDFKMGKADGHFTYVEDPDGTLIEFVETFKVPIMKKLGIYLHLRNDSVKPLPRIITKALRLLK